MILLNYMEIHTIIIREEINNESYSYSPWEM